MNLTIGKMRKNIIKITEIIKYNMDLELIISKESITRLRKFWNSLNVNIISLNMMIIINQVLLIKLLLKRKNLYIKSIKATQEKKNN